MGIKKQLATDDENFLSNLNDWSSQVAEYIAQQEDVLLTEQHWQFITFLRRFYQEYQHIPKMRILIKALLEEYPADFANSQRLYELFPGGPIKQGCKIAGLPKPPHCT